MVFHKKKIKIEPPAPPTPPNPPAPVPQKNATKTAAKKPPADPQTPENPRTINEPLEDRQHL